MDKYEYLTGEDLECKPGVVEIATFKYSPLGKVFIRIRERRQKKKNFWKDRKMLKI